MRSYGIAGRDVVNRKCDATTKKKKKTLPPYEGPHYLGGRLAMKVPHMVACGWPKHHAVCVRGLRLS